MSKNLKVLIAASEVSTFAQTGGLAEVAGSLPLAFASLGIETAVIMPAYREALKNKTVGDAGIEFAVGRGDARKTAKLLKGELRSDDKTPAVPVYLVDYPPHFDRDGIYEADKTAFPDNHVRFAFFSKAVIAAFPLLGGDPPDIILANDWQTGLIMPYLLELGPDAPKGVFVIHNQGFLGLAPPEAKADIGLPESYYGVNGLEYHGLLSYLKAGIVYSKTLITVSPTYAKEIQTPEEGHGLDGLLREHSFKLHGILNGVDYKVWDPANDPHIPAVYTRDNLEGKRRCKEAFLKLAGLPDDPERPLFAMVSRLTAQKGISLVIEAAKNMFSLGTNLAILGTGEPWFQERLQALALEFPENFWLKLDYNANLSHLMVAAADFVLVPSTYEPCGLIQLYALRYGAIPVVRATGGLNDTVRDFAGQNPSGLWDTGFKFSSFNERALFRAVRRATELYRRKDDFTTMCKNNMGENFSWETSARSYYSVFLNITKSA
ncbi:MAG: glycogen synthase GlgA [Deltaproteobacteria bacterium]|jgi:starch synthase|nr:glycogen synthase GlgA [Deltaproteobacteria bacterium]